MNISLHATESQAVAAAIPQTASPATAVVKQRDVDHEASQHTALSRYRCNPGNIYHRVCLAAAVWLGYRVAASPQKLMHVKQDL